MVYIQMTTQELAYEVISRLKKEYPDADCTLDYDDAWKLLVSVRLAAQCTDARVNVVVQDLYAKYPDVAALAAAEPEDIEAIVRPCGLGKVKASSKNERFCITLPPQASDYVHENRKPREFLVRFISTVARHGCTLDEVMDVFHAYSEHVHVEKTTGTGFDYLVYFEDGIPDDYRYCLSLEGEHMIYHKFTPEDYEDFGF